MKHTTLLIVVFALTSGNLRAQCKSALKAKSENHTEGAVLMAQEITEEKTEIPVVLNGSFTYGFYIFGKEGNTPPSVTFHAADGSKITDLKLIYDKEVNFRHWKFKAPASGKYKLIFDNPDKQCALYLLSFISQ